MSWPVSSGENWARGGLAALLGDAKLWLPEEKHGLGLGNRQNDP